MQRVIGQPVGFEFENNRSIAFVKIGDAFEAEYCKSGILPGEIFAVKTPVQSGLSYLKTTLSIFNSP